MTRPPVWKVVTAGAATSATPTAVHSGVAAPMFAPIDWAVDSFDSPDEFVTAMDDSWDDSGD